MTAVILELPRRDVDPERGQGFAPHRWLLRQLAEERDRFVLWLPGFMSLGIGLYFLLPAEPPLIVGIILGALIIAPVFLLPFKLRSLIVLPLAAMWLGFVASEIRTRIVASPVLARELYAEITGTVRWREPLDDGRLRLVLDVERIERLVASETPRRVRVSLRGVETWPAIGDVVALKASLAPPSGPVAPGAYDFARIAWFQGIGAVGYGGNTLRIVKPAERADDTIARWYATLRTTIQARIEAALPQREAAIATALTVGARGGISRQDTEAMQNAGVSHVLSISGLHLALIAGLIFVTVRGGLALIEPFALRFPVKKIAAFAALLGAGFYVGISDGSAPIIRSFIMFAVAILAVLIDRPALSLRTVAFAAALILLISPESLLDPSFQMSFAAVIGLVAAYEWSGERQRGREEPKMHLPWLVRSIVATGVTSLVAETATSPFAAYHFNQFQGYGLIANEVVVPLLGFFIMPLGALAVLLMPLGLEDWPLKAMGWGIDQMLATAHWTAGLPGAVIYLQAWPVLALIAMALGGLWLALWRRRWRLAGVPIALLGLAIALMTPASDAFIGEEGDKLAFRVRSDRGWSYGLMGVRQTSYRGEVWLQRLGARPTSPLDASGLVKCDALGCLLPVGRGGELSLVRDGRALAEECASAKALVSLVRVQESCARPQVVLDRSKLKYGAAALRFDKSGPRVAFAANGKRPWEHGYIPLMRDD